MDPWNQGQKRMFSQQRAGHPTMNPHNANHPQNFYQPANAQQFYPNPAGIQGQPDYQPGQNQPGHVSSRPQHFILAATQPLPSQRQMTQAEMDNIRKKKNFEEQQRRLLALKQPGGHSRMGNPLNDLFGKKGSASSFLGSLGNTPRPKDVAPAFSGLPVSGQIVSGFGGTNTGYNSSSLPVTSTSSSPNWNVAPQTNVSSQPGNFEAFKGIAEAKNVQDDFGDFQQNVGNDLSGNVEVSLALGPTSYTPGVSVINQNIEKTSSSGVLVPSTTIGSNSTSSEHSMVQAVATPSIEELMKKSLSLDNEPQSSVKFQKPKLAKVIRSQPSHFTESTKASKWDNLETLSEMFTLPQSALAHAPQVQVHDNQSQLIGSSSDDWSELSGADGTVFPRQGLVQGSLEHTPVKSDHILPSNSWEGGQETLLGGPGALFNPGTQTVQSEPGWGAQGWHDSTNMMPGVPNLPVSQAMTGGPVTTIRSEVLQVLPVAMGHQNQGPVVVEEVIQEPPVDPEQQIYGVRLPGWSKDMTLLPSVYKQIYRICSSDSSDISTSQLYPILLSSDLSRDKLGHIWSQCNKAAPGQLNEQELYLILGMVALAQVGLQVNKLTLEKLASCTTAPIPSFPEKIFQSDVDSMSSVQPPQTTSVESKTLLVGNDTFKNETRIISDTSFEHSLSNKSSVSAIAAKQPDWSKWKTSKAGHVDDKFTDFKVLLPKDRSGSFQGNDSTVLPNLNFATASVVSDPMDSFASFQSSGDMVPVSSGSELTNNGLNTPMSTTTLSDSSVLVGTLKKPVDGSDVSLFPTDTSNNQNAFPEFQSFSSADAGKDNTSNTLGGFTSASGPAPEAYVSLVENKLGYSSAHVMSVPLQASQRYTLTGEDETIDHHEKAWLKCLTSCFAVIMKSCQSLQIISDPNLMNEIFSSSQGISHFSAIIEIYCVSQRVKASVLKSAPNNKKLKESLQNIDNVWKTCLSFQPFKTLLPTQSLNFSGCHVDENEDLNLTCGVCLLNVDKSWVNSMVNKGRSGKLSYGNRFYHTTCANFWCNKVDSVLPALQLNVGNSLI